MADFDGIVNPTESEWADIPSISTQMRLLGGKDGAGQLNQQAVAIAKRLNSLKRDQDAITGEDGAGVVGYDGGVASDVLDGSKPMQSYEALRAYTGRAFGARITTPALAGTFDLDAADTITPDNGGTVIVDAASRRWKRNITGPVMATWFHLAGTGVDETDKINAFMEAAAGRDAELEYGKVYGYRPVTKTVTVKAGTRLRTNGAKFVETAAAATDRFVIESDVTIDELNIDFIGAETARGIRIAGSNVKIGNIRAISLQPMAGAGNIRRRPLTIGTEGGARITGIEIGRIEIRDWDHSVAVFRTDFIKIGRIDHENLKNGVWLQDVRNAEIGGGYIRGLSPNATGGPGENSILIESTEHRGSANISIRNVVSEDASEHAFRIGGAKVVDNVTYLSCTAIRPGAAAGTSGGSGFKCLGSTDLANVGIYHQNIRWVDCVVEDVQWSVKTDNFAGFNIGKTWNFSLVNPIVRKSIRDQAGDPYTPPEYSCYNGIEILGSFYGTITNPQIISPVKYGIQFYDLSSAADWGSENTFHSVVGGIVQAPGEAGVGYLSHTIPFRRITIQGLRVEGGKHHGYAESSGGGVFIQCVHEGIFYGGVDAVETIQGMAGFRVDLMGTEVGDNACVNGSMFRTATGAFKIRKGAAWVTL